MSQTSHVKTFKDSNYFQQGTYKRQFKDYIYQIGFANIITRTVLAPLQRWRIIKQTQKTYPLRPLTFNNFFNYLSRIPKQQGITAFWRGNVAGLWLYFTQTCIQIGFYDNLKRLSKDLTLQQQKDSIFTLITERLFIPVITSFFTQIITFPMDTARIRITMNYQKQRSKAAFKGIRTCLKHLRAQQNFSAMYKGFFLSNIISLINFNFFIVFSNLANQTQLGSDVSKLINTETIASVASLALIHPLDTLKKIIQLNNLSSPSIITNYRSALQYVNRQLGYSCLYNGFLASMLKSFFLLPTFYLAKNLLNQVQKQF